MRLTTQQKATYTFYSLMGIFTIAVIAATVLLAMSAPILAKLAHSVVSTPQQTCNCSSYASLVSQHPYHTVIVSFVGLLASLFLLFVLFNLAKGAIKTTTFKRRTLGNRVRSSPKLLDVAHSINLQPRVMEVRSGGYLVFCLGFIRPMICLSSALIRSISKNQLRAMLLHEKNHLQFRDPVKIFLAGVVNKSLFFIPGVRNLVQQFETAAELAADERATNNLKEVRSLGKALLTMTSLQSEHSPLKSNWLAATFLNATEVRIDVLINQRTHRILQWFIPKLFLGLLIALGLFVILLNSQALQAKTYKLTAAPSSDGLACSVVATTPACGPMDSSCYTCSAPPTSCTMPHHQDTGQCPVS